MPRTLDRQRLERLMADEMAAFWAYKESSGI